MGDALELAAEGGVDFGMPVAVQVGPDGGVGIQVAAAVNIREPGALAGGDDDGFRAEPVAHLRERMPDVAVIKLGEGVHFKVASAAISWETSAVV